MYPVSSRKSRLLKAAYGWSFYSIPGPNIGLIKDAHAIANSYISSAENSKAPENNILFSDSNESYINIVFSPNFYTNFFIDVEAISSEFETYGKQTFVLLP